ncbi:dTDP-4-dehydrorhamnose reductase [Shimia sagamensis]|uniref:dTDP-4-dehydrorhamnose reductase n=1 Tax=Shimia sagamensis TaxID=1566352 RepID=A0ABY1NCA5_9RHOB|nr:dTDP-4-dehydrorhamnose reductase [Shimia sagamensis]SMP05452.1 dTDP-4-dehydrorhamnose reductase [Shimia sagamensis]
MKVLVFGKTGQVAQELQALAGPDVQIEALSRSEADLQNPSECAERILATDADVVINAAAYTAVDQAETEPDIAEIINATAPGAMAKAAAVRNLPFLHISTDYVFAGAGDTPHEASDPTDPINVYGRSKLAGEEAVRVAGGKYVILRTSWVFSAHGTNFVKSMLRLSESRDALSIVADQHGGPTPAGDIAATLLTMALGLLEGKPSGTYHYAGTPTTTWADFARAIFQSSNRSVMVTNIPSSGFPTPAKRPLNSRLDCATLLSDFGVTPPDWQAGLTRVITQLEQGDT